MHTQNVQDISSNGKKIILMIRRWISTRISPLQPQLQHQHQQLSTQAVWIINSSVNGLLSALKTHDEIIDLLKQDTFLLYAYFRLRTTLCLCKNSENYSFVLSRGITLSQKVGIPLHLPFLLFPSPPLHLSLLSLPYPLEAGTLIEIGSMGECCKAPPTGSGADPRPPMHFCAISAD